MQTVIQLLVFGFLVTPAAMFFIAREYVFDEVNRAFMERSNPWALRGIAERLLEAAERGMWAKPDDAVLDRLRATYLELEGDLEGNPQLRRCRRVSPGPGLRLTGRARHPEGCLDRAHRGSHPTRA